MIPKLLTGAKRLILVVLACYLSMAATCAPLKSNPNDSEIQATRKLALQVFNAVELAGVGTEGVQTFEIQMYRAGKISDDGHRAFQTDMLITARMVRTGLTQIQLATSKPELKNTVQLIIDNLNDLNTKYGTKYPDIGPMIRIVGAGLSVIVTILG
jgi:hypothetical protein